MSPSSLSSLPDDSSLLVNDDASAWWKGLDGELGLSFGSAPLSFDATDSGLFNGNFVPPPPRPPFLDESAQFDGLTTCGMCSWATKNDHLLATNSTLGENSPTEWSFPVVIVVVSLISALIGAFVMVTFLRCRRLKAGNSAGRSAIPWWPQGTSRPVSTGGPVPHRPQAVAKHGTDTIRVPPQPSSNSGTVWTWLGQRRVPSGPDPLSQPSSSPAENHYTHMDDSYNPELGEALYAELDRESLQSGNPSYQNTAYSACGEADKELQVFSSAPSSAYYSDLSVTTTTIPTGTERTYEMVGLTAINQNCCPLLLEADGGSSPADQALFDLNLPSHPSSVGRRHHRLSAINEGGGAGGGVTSCGVVGGGGAASHLQPSDFV